MEASIIIRTLNEARWLPHLLDAIRTQEFDGHPAEIVVVDSGSTDNTLTIAEMYQCRVVHITKERFTFGRSLNMGCEAARGKALVFISGHCIPVGNRWLADLILPLQLGQAEYVYGRQEGYGPTKYSENQLFKKYYPLVSSVPKADFFCNNANAAILKSTWSQAQFSEELTGLEDMELAKRLLRSGRKIGYVAESSVFHIHDETWIKVRNRYEREAVALQSIMPEVHVSIWDFVRYFSAGVVFDFCRALDEGVFLKHAREIVLFRLMQFWGTYRGNNEHRQMSSKRKETYFYPR